MTDSALNLLREIAMLTRHDRNVGNASEGKWLTLNVPGLLLVRIDAFLDRPEQVEAKWPDDLEAGFLHAMEVAKMAGATPEILAAMRVEWDRDATKMREHECFWCGKVRENAAIQVEAGVDREALKLAGMVLVPVEPTTEMQKE